MSDFAQVGSGQVLGLREEQQDAMGFGTLVLGDGRRAPLAVLADGMGGHHGGAIAARLAIGTFLASCRASSERTFTGALEAALLAANRALAARSRDDPRLAQMGCTLIAAAVEGGVLHYVSVGDSLLWRVSAGRLERLNADHSMMPVVNAAVARGTMSQAEAQAHGSILRSAVTGRPIELVDLRSVELARDEWLLLASDGILSLDEAEVHSLIRPMVGGAQARVDAVLDAVEQAGAPEQDNCTVVLLPMSLVAASVSRRPLTTVLGTLAVLAGFGVVGVAGWELLRLASPFRTPTMAAATPPAAPAGEVTQDKMLLPPAPDNTLEPRPARADPGSPQVQPSEAPARTGLKPSRQKSPGIATSPSKTEPSTPKSKVKPTSRPASSPTSTPTLLPSPKISPSPANPDPKDVAQKSSAVPATPASPVPTPQSELKGKGN